MSKQEVGDGNGADDGAGVRALGSADGALEGADDGSVVPPKSADGTAVGPTVGVVVPPGSGVAKADGSTLGLALGSAIVSSIGPYSKSSHGSPSSSRR